MGIVISEGLALRLRLLLTLKDKKRAIFIGYQSLCHA